MLVRFGELVDGVLWSEHDEELKAEALAWRLLLQVDVADWTQAEYTEGTVYFPIRPADLAARRFDTVVAVYQQT